MPAIKFTPEIAQRAAYLFYQPRPMEIIVLNRRIETAKRLATQHLLLYGYVEPWVIETIVGMRLEKDGLYAAWFDGRIG
ncbi:MAG: hypothetical protein WC565_02745 [Parcubacteria group bacterium]